MTQNQAALLIAGVWSIALSLCLIAIHLGRAL